MPVTVRSAKPGEQPVIENLMQLYLHDFSEFDEVDVQPNGEYIYPYLKYYWQEPDRFPFLIRLDGELAGFALVRTEVDALTAQPRFSLAEFFILRRLRNLGVGRQAADKLWDLLPGSWIVEVMESNQDGYLFWKKVIAQYAKQGFEEESVSARGRRWTRFTFSS